MSKCYDIELWHRAEGDNSSRAYLALVRMHSSDDLACYAVGATADDVYQRVWAIGEKWQEKWDADAENRAARIEAARVAREKRAAAKAAEQA